MGIALAAALAAPTSIGCSALAPKTSRLRCVIETLGISAISSKTGHMGKYIESTSSTITT